MANRHISVEMANKIENETQKRKINFSFLRKQIILKKENGKTFAFQYIIFSNIFHAPLALLLL